jgi:adenylate cyclase
MNEPNDERTMGGGFKPAPVPDNEAERLREVSVLGLTGVNRKDPALNDIILITCAVADTPIAMVNILDRPDQHTLRSCGMPEAVPTETPIEGSLCQFVLAQGDVLIIEDLRTDERTREHPLINPPMSLRFYAGAPLVSASGYIIGTLCVMAPEPKTLDPRAVDALRRLADQVVRMLQGGPPRDDGDVVATAKEKTPVRGQFHSQASVLFTDFVDFTRHTEALEPAELLETLARNFSAFDKICERFELTRIKTIGDSYMAAAGIPAASADHARDAVAAALTIRDYIAAENSARVALGEPAWEIRIGVHSGPAIAGSLGEHGNLDIWGDTVNVAARLEAASDAGRVNISEATLTLLGNATTEERGTVPLKNKAPLRMYFVDQLN